MLPFFPDPYPDELLYSVLARYHRWSQNLAVKYTVSDLFSRNSASAIIDFPTRLDKLESLLPDGTIHTADSMIFNYTMFPLFYPFLPQERADKLFLSMKAEDEGMGVYNYAGLMASGVRSYRNLRLCPLCFQSDQLNYGEAYWHRLHQVPGVEVCPEHNCYLEDSNVMISPKFNKHQYFRLSDEVVDIVIHPRYVEPGLHSELTLQVARGVMWLLGNVVPSLGLEGLLSRYRQLLYQNGYISAQGHIRQRELSRAFSDFYGNEFLEGLGCRVDLVKGESWLHRLVRSSRSSSHPLRHILVLCFLRTNPQEFLQGTLSGSSGPFGEGPWPCLNAAADHYKRNTIETCVVTGDSKLGIPVGTFICSCGFIYSRRGPDKVEADRYRYGRIKEFGPVWERKVVQLYVVEQRSLRETGRLLQVDPMTVKHRVQRLTVVKQAESGGPDLSEKREEYRSRWCLLKQKNPKLTKTELRRLEPAIYMWLYRHDQSWLLFDFPTFPRQNLHYERVNWQLRDNELARKVIDIAIRLYTQTEKPVRVTASRVGKITGSLALLQKHINKLPETNGVLCDVVENLEEYQIRRVKWAVKLLHENGQPVKRWVILRKAGLKPHTSPLVELHVALEVEKAKMMEGNTDWL